ncbi:30S ribosomal protein S18 [Sulfuriroseicoccus oceanibius]|uniref:30S ribosomal protein S18 n=1 Tax=Sulfuriroseicoccus oceanibius TaxID=2707525 RepID=A0A6B3LAY0_9BACT|nr:30S ribosomal protein S18 [Sulfuriroseicoccus oceanibius]
MEPKTKERRANFRRANKIMPRRRIDLPVELIEAKNTEILKKFTTESGKILPRRVTGVSAKMHRKVTREIKRARALNLLP